MSAWRAEPRAAGRAGRATPRALAALCTAVTLLSSGCAHHLVNEPLTRVDPDSGYRFSSLDHPGNSDSLFVILTFSGGGTRAAALAYGVLRELATIEIPAQDGSGTSTTLLDEVDVISSVSGGSFTAAYYALFRGERDRERLFEDFERVFLRRDVQGALKRQLLVPTNWFLLPSHDYDRIDMAARWYDRNVFEGRTFGDLVTAGERPFVVLNATDMGGGNHFEFTQDRFDYLCSDLSTYPVARGVAASSAFPGLLTPLTLDNHSLAPVPEPRENACDFVPPPRVANALADREVNPRRYTAAEERVAYLEGRPFVHLVDGGVADNIGLRGPYEALTSEVSAWSLLPRINGGDIETVLVIVVNAKKSAGNRIDQQEQAPWLLPTLQTASTTPMGHYSFETIELLRESFEARKDEQRLIEALARRCPDCDVGESPVDEVEYLDVVVSFDRVADPKTRKELNELPTSFSLPDDAIDALIGVGPEVLAKDEAFQKLLERLRGES